MFFQQPPATTFNFMVFGYIVILGVMALFLISLVVRFRNLTRDLKLLEEIEAEQQAQQ